MATSSSQTKELPDPEELSLSMLAEGSSSSSESAQANEKDGDVESLLPPDEENTLRPRRSRAKIYFWMALNVMANLSIVPT